MVGRWSPWIDNDPWSCIPCVWAIMGEKKEISQQQQQQQKEKEDYDYPWWKLDRLVALQLMKHGTCMYDCDAAKQFLQPYAYDDHHDGDIVPSHVADILGEYDVVFGRFETHFEYPDPNTIYIHKHNILRKQTLGENSCGRLFCNPRGRFHEVKLCGHFIIRTPYPGIVPTEIIFEYPEPWQSGPYSICIYEGSCLNGALCEIQTLTQDVALDWIPHNSAAGDSAYAQAVRHEIEQERRRPLLWLCRHKDIPEDVSTIVREYTSPRPNMKFWLHRDDLWITIEFEDENHGVLTADLVLRRLQQQET